MSDTVTITLDGREVEAAAGEMLIAVADREGVAIPRFCYHPKLAVAANCRMCLVEVAGARGPVPACATPVTDGMDVQTRSDPAREAQRATMEFLLINHPLDCPICDQGGECELQDLALEYGSGVSRYSEARRAVPDPDLGPLVSTDMTRCIHCTRCVRFTEEIAGEQELGAFGRGEFMKIGTYVEQAMNSELSGCVIDLCPVGALNARPSRMSARAWELSDHPGLGEHDGVGSQLSRHTLRGRQIRCVPRTEESINEGWLSDRDRFSYQAASHPDRLCWPMIRGRNAWVRISWEEALDRAAEALSNAEAPTGLIHPSSTVEECFRFQQLLRRSGTATVEHRVRMTDFRGGGLYPNKPSLGCSLEQIAEHDLIVLMGSFLRHDQPILNHRLRQAIQSGAEVWVINPVPFDSRNFNPAEEVVLSPRQWLILLQAVERAHALSVRESYARLSDRLAQRLGEAQRALFWLGPLALNHPDASLLYASARSLCDRAGARLGHPARGRQRAGRLADRLRRAPRPRRRGRLRPRPVRALGRTVRPVGVLRRRPGLRRGRPRATAPGVAGGGHRHRLPVVRPGPGTAPLRPAAADPHGGRAQRPPGQPGRALAVDHARRARSGRGAGRRGGAGRTAARRRPRPGPGRPRPSSRTAAAWTRGRSPTRRAARGHPAPAGGRPAAGRRALDLPAGPGDPARPCPAADRAGAGAGPAPAPERP